MTLHVETLGQGPDLVLVHGWGMNAGVWAPVAEALASNHRVSLVDLPGHGNSAYAATSGTLADWATEVRSVVAPKAAWIGWSLGAQVAVQAALDAPEAVTRLGLIAGTPRFVQDVGWAPAMPASTFQRFAADLAADPKATLERFLALQIRGAEHAVATLRRLKQALRARPLPRPPALRAGLELLLGTDLRQVLGDIQKPTLWLLGERDTLVPAAMARELARLQPGARACSIAGAGHAPFLSHREDALALLTDFLAEDEPGG